jgi:hypothetical protein
MSLPPALLLFFLFCWPLAQARGALLEVHSISFAKGAAPHFVLRRLQRSVIGDIDLQGQADLSDRQ